MSIYRLITRLAVVSALNNYMKTPWPTLAGGHIFDSKIEPVEDIKSDIMFPCVVVYTDYDKDHWSKTGKAHEPRVLSLTVELLVVQAELKNDIYKLDCPMTDSEIETTLDILESQVFKALSAGTVASDAFNYICQSSVNTVSRRGASVEGGLRLAARQITIECSALREPLKGVIPVEVARFLDELGRHSDYTARVPEIRKVLTDSAGDTYGETMMKVFGYTRDATGMLGIPAAPMPVLPPNIVWHFNGIQP